MPWPDATLTTRYNVLVFPFICNKSWAEYLGNSVCKDLYDFAENEIDFKRILSEIFSFEMLQTMEQEFSFI